MKESKIENQQKTFSTYDEYLKAYYPNATKDKEIEINREISHFGRTLAKNMMERKSAKG
jgi:hypothetical protein